MWVRGFQRPQGGRVIFKVARGSVGVRGDGDVDDEDALVGNAALQGDGGGLHLEAH